MFTGFGGSSAIYNISSTASIFSDDETQAKNAVFIASFKGRLEILPNFFWSYVWTSIFFRPDPLQNRISKDQMSSREGNNSLWELASIAEPNSRPAEGWGIRKFIGRKSTKKINPSYSNYSFEMWNNVGVKNLCI